MIKLIRLLPSEILALEKRLARMDKIGREAGIIRDDRIRKNEQKAPELYKKGRGYISPSLYRAIEEDDVIVNLWNIEVMEDFVLSREQKMFYSKVDDHLEKCYYCQNGEYCENLGGILAA